MALRRKAQQRLSTALSGGVKQWLGTVLPRDVKACPGDARHCIGNTRFSMAYDQRSKSVEQGAGSVRSQGLHPAIPRT